MYEAATNGNSTALSRADVAYLRLREMLLSQELPGGQPFSEAEITRKLELSRTPVREALQRLEVEGYVTSNAGRGYTVVELTAQDIVNVYRVRAVLEGLAAYEAAQKINRATLGRLEDLYEAMEAARTGGDDAQLAELTSAFHHSIASASNNRYLESTLNNIYDTFERFRTTALTRPGRRDSSAQEHGELIQALRDGDAERARSIAREHVENALQVRQAAMDSQS